MSLECVPLFLSVRDVTAYYGDICALRDVVLDVAPHQTVALIGANGAGKSTLLKIVMGLMHPKQGQLFYQGQEMTAWPVYQRVSSGIVLSPEGRGVFARLTVEDNLRMGAFTRANQQWVRHKMAQAYDRWPMLYDKRKILAGVLSGGEQQVLALSRALMSEPSLLCLDEPTLGLAPVFIDLVFAWLAELKQSGLTILLVEQNADRALSLADYGYALEVGHIVASGPAHELARSSAILSAYFG